MPKRPTYEELKKEVAELKKVEAECKKVKKALKKSERKYYALFEYANDAICLSKGRYFVDCNKKVLEIFGCKDKKEIIGKTYLDFSPERQPDGTISKDKGDEKIKLAYQGIPQFFEWKHCRVDGTPFDAEVSLAKIELKGEKFHHAIIRDITQRKEAERSLRKAFSEIEQLKKRLERDYTYLQEEIKLEHNFEEIIGESPSLQHVLFKIEQIALTDTIVLILGETGVGKELVARAIHNSSHRKHRPLVKVDCATLPSSLIENELFGHEKGAFTGAQSKQIGRFEFANGSTIFLDEVSELPLELQSKLLRVLQDGQLERLGNPRTIQTDVRVIAATNRNLAKEVQKGRFREDLWYRLNVLPITVPPLRERKDDIPLLVNWFVDKYSSEFGKFIKTVPQHMMKKLQSYTWPGNVRELENVIERSVILSRDSTLEIDLPDVWASKDYQNATLDDIQRRHIRSVLKKNGGRIRGKNGAAQILGLKPTTLASKMKKLGIERLQN